MSYINIEVLPLSLVIGAEIFGVDLAMWDNRCTMHFATSDFSGRRSMNRVTVLGDRPYH